MATVTLEPKPSFADGSKLYNPGQPTNPKIPPCRSFALALSFKLGNHLLINVASKIHTGTTCLVNSKYFTFGTSVNCLTQLLYWAVSDEVFGFKTREKGFETKTFQLPPVEPTESMRK